MYGSLRLYFHRRKFNAILRGTSKGHIARAALEAIALRSRDIILEMQKDAGVDFKTLKVDGGASNNDLLMQIQSDVLGAEVIRPEETETTALGAAFLAGLAVGVSQIPGRRISIYSARWMNIGGGCRTISTPSFPGRAWKGW